MGVGWKLADEGSDHGSIGAQPLLREERVRQRTRFFFALSLALSLRAWA